jgi:biopolymer transport protein ExbB/TolQ
MKKSLSSAMGLLCVCVGLMMVTPQGALAQDHVVSPAQIQKDVAGASAERQQNTGKLESFLSSKEAQQAMKTAHINEQQVKTAVKELSDEDLAQLSARAEKAQREFAAGTLSDRDLLIILVAVAALILIIVAVR